MEKRTALWFILIIMLWMLSSIILLNVNTAQMNEISNARAEQIEEVCGCDFDKAVKEYYGITEYSNPINDLQGPFYLDLNTGE